jgi:multidrug efflux system membrane fusion protein
MSRHQFRAEPGGHKNIRPLKPVLRPSSLATRTPGTGELTFIDNAVDKTTGTIKLKGTFDNNDRRLWPGQFVDVILTLTTEPNRVLVPTSAVQTGQQGQYVYVIKDDMTAELRIVKTGRTMMIDHHRQWRRLGRRSSTGTAWCRERR